MKRAEIERLLPAVFRRTALPGSPLAVLLEVMEALHAPDEAVLDELDRYVDPYRAPPAFVRYLASWVALDWLVASQGRDDTVSEGALRDLVASGAALARVRGTREGLRRLLSLATGGAEFEVVPARAADGSERPFAITVIGPPELEPKWALVEAIVRHEKPACVQHEITFASTPPPVPAPASEGESA